MPDPTPDPVTDQPPVVTPPPADPPAATPLADVPADQLDAERLRQTVLAQRQRETQLATRAAAAEQELATIRQAQETEAQRIQRERDEALAGQTAATEQLRRGYLLAELSRPEHQIVDAEAAATLIDGVAFGEDGRPTNVGERVEALLATRTFLKAGTPAPPPPPPAPNVNPGGGSGDGPPPTLTVDEATFAQEQGIDPAHFAALKTIDDAPNQYEAWLALREARKAPKT